MKKFLLAVCCLLAFSAQASAQIITKNLSIGTNMLLANKTPGTQTITFQLNMPTSAESIAIVAQPHTNVALSSGVSITLFQSNNTNVSPVPGATSFGMQCFIGSGGVGLPIAISMSSAQSILLNTTTSAGVANCQAPTSYGAQLTVIEGGTGGATYDLFVVVATLPMQPNSYCIPAVASGACNTQVISGVNGSGNVQNLKTDTNGGLSVVAFAGTPGVDGQSNQALFIRSDTGVGLTAPIEAGQYLLGTNGWFKQRGCNSTASFNVASTTTQVVAAVAAQTPRICAYMFAPSTATAGSVSLVYGTGTNCGTGTVTLFTIPLPAANVAPISQTFNSATFGPLSTSQALCISTTTATVQGYILFEQEAIN